MNSVKITFENFSNNIVNLSTKQSRSINIFLLGFSIYSIVFVVGAPGKFNLIICQIIQIIGFIILVYGAVPILEFRIKNKYLQFIFPIYIFWLLLIIIRGYLIFARVILAGSWLYIQPPSSKLITL